MSASPMVSPVSVDGPKAAEGHRPQKPERGQRLVALDGMRFIAAVIVLFAHFIGLNSTIWPDSPRETFPQVHYASAYGILGVEFFFLISGFVICMSAWGRSLGEFFVSRIVRLYPAYWAAILLIAAVQFLLPLPGVQPPKIGTILVNLSMFSIPAKAPLMTTVVWTLWVEMCFYLIFSIVVWRGLTYRRVVFFCLFWLIGSLIANSASDATLNTILQPAFSTYFIAGIAIYLMYRFGPTMLTWGIVISCWLLSMFAVQQRIADNRKPMVELSLAWWPAQLLVTVFFLLMLALAFGWFDRIRARWLTTLGAMTYPIYLIHWTVGYAVIKRLSPKVPAWPLLFGTIALLMLLSWLIHRWVEKPLAPLLKRGLKRSLTEMNSGTRPRSREQGSPVPAVAAPVPVQLPRWPSWDSSSAQPGHETPSPIAHGVAGRDGA